MSLDPDFLVYTKNCCLTGLILFFSFLQNPVDAQKPNVVFIAVDDLNDWIGCLGGHPQAQTPNMDRLARRGVLFTNAHCAAPACNPSRAAVFSGRKPQVTGVWANQSGQSLKNNFPQGKILPQVFSDAGYLCLGTGKLLHSGSGRKEFAEFFSVNQRWSPFSKNKVRYTKEELGSKGTDRPRHEFKDRLGRTVVLPLNGMPSDRKPGQTDGESFDWGPFDLPDSDFGDTQITDWAIEKIQMGSDKPLFLAIGYYRPHIPLWAPKRFFDRFQKSPARLPESRKNDLQDLSEIGKEWAIEPVTAGRHQTVVRFKQWQSAVEAYLACVTYVDHEIGRLLEALDKSSMADNTLVVLWSDHGWHLGEKQHWGKWTGWERSTKVPLVIVPAKNFGKRVFRNARCDQPVSLLDLYPTLVDYCGMQVSGELDGESLVPWLSQPGKTTERAVTTMFDRGNYSVRTENFRYIQYKQGSEELYDHQKDPNEWKNLAGKKEYEQVMNALRQKAAEFETR
ncbi:MAG: sulfatase [Planctomycetota bacterium]|nr:sulfatase [Planctomycetota bacterium]